MSTPKKAAAPKHDEKSPPADAPGAEVKTMAFEIEDNIPIPVRKVGAKSEGMYPFKELGVGQSFFIPVSDKMKTPWKTFTSVASRFSRELHPKQFTTARDTKAGVEGVRIWRKPDTTEPLKEPKKINRRPRGSVQAEKERLAAEAAAGDTSNKRPPEDPAFLAGENGGAPPPPPPPAA